MITNINLLDFNKTYSYTDYLTWIFKERLELFNGKIFKISTAINRIHQVVSRNLHEIMWAEFKNKSCNLYAAPFGVRLLNKNKSTANQDVFKVVQPDLCLICDENKLDDKGAVGAPDLIIEILSSGNSKKEMKYKYDLYEESGVLEYWIVNPSDKTILIFVLKDSRFVGLHPLIEEDKIKSLLFPSLNFDFKPNLQFLN